MEKLKVCAMLVLFVLVVMIPTATATDAPYEDGIQLDKDYDGWMDLTEQTIQKYYPEFDWMNETPTKETVVKAVSNAVIQYFSTDDPEKREEIIDDVVIIINEFYGKYLSLLP